MENNNLCRIPVQATMRKIGDKFVMVSAEWAEIPADVIARFLIERSGITPVLVGGGGEIHYAAE